MKPKETFQENVIRLRSTTAMKWIGMIHLCITARTKHEETHPSRTHLPCSALSSYTVRQNYND